MNIRFLRRAVPSPGTLEFLELSPVAGEENFGLSVAEETATFQVIRHGKMVVIVWQSSVGNPTSEFAQAVFKKLLLEKTLLFLTEKGNSFYFTKEIAVAAQ